MAALNAQTPRAVFIGSGTRGPFSLQDTSGNPIRVRTHSHLLVRRYSSTTDETGTLLVLNTDYTVTNTDVDAVTVTLTSAQAVLTSTQRLVVTRLQSIADVISLAQGGDFSGPALAAAISILAEREQELRRDVDRSIKVDWRETSERTVPIAPATGAALLARNSAGALIHAAAGDFGDGTPVQADWLSIVTGQAPGAGWPAAFLQDIDEILDDAKGIRVCATYAEMTALAADELTDNCVVATYSRTAEEDGGFGFWRYDSGSSATANGGTILAIDGGGAGRFFRLDDLPINIRHFIGAASSDSATAFEAAVAATKAANDDVGFVHVPGGPIISITSFVDDVVNVGFDQIAPRYTGSQAPNWSVDGEMYGTASRAARAWRILEGSNDTDGDFFPQFFGLIVDPTSSPADYIKGPIYWRGVTTDPSDVGGGIDRDLSALGQGIIRAGNATGRAWALDLVGHVESTADGLLSVLELNCLNQGTTQNTLNTSTTKSGLRIFASLGAITSAIHIDYDSASASNEFYHAISINPTAIASGGYAFLLDGLAAIMATGAAVFGDETPRSGYTLTLNSSGSTKQAIISDGANQSLLAFIDAGTTVVSIGLDNTTGRLRGSYAENLNTALFEFSPEGNFSHGGSIPSIGAGTKTIYFPGATVPTVAPPSNGGFLYSKAGVATWMDSAGVEHALY